MKSRLNERDLSRIVRRVINEGTFVVTPGDYVKLKKHLETLVYDMDKTFNITIDSANATITFEGTDDKAGKTFTETIPLSDLTKVLPNM